MFRLSHKRLIIALSVLLIFALIKSVTYSSPLNPWPLNSQCAFEKEISQFEAPLCFNINAFPCTVRCEELCPQVNSAASHLKEGSKLTQTFSYRYQNSPFDLGSETRYQNISSDGKQTLQLASVLVHDVSESCYFKPLCNGPFANFWIKIAVTWEDNTCKDLYGKAMEVCHQKTLRSSRFANRPPELARTLHLGGPFFSDNGNCEFYDHGLVGSQQVDYDQFILWDWDDWKNQGLRAVALDLLIYESDEGIGDDRLISFRVTRDLEKSEVFSNKYLKITLKPKPQYEKSFVRRTSVAKGLWD